jgi:methylmalonyl-CoA mutase
MTQSSDILPLAADFPPATYAHWRKLVQELLKGAPFDRELVRLTYDGLRVQPLYARDAQAQPVIGRAGGRGWQVLQRVDHPDPAAANLGARHECESGAAGLSLIFAGSLGAYDYGLDPGEHAIARALEGIELAPGGFAIELDLGPRAESAARAIVSLIRRQAIAADAEIRFGLDPLGVMATHGGAPLGVRETAIDLGRLVADLAAAGCKGPLAVADGRAIHNAGGTEAQELSFALAAAIFYLRAIEAAGIGLDAARGMIFFRLSADADEFLTIAKFRALRRLWARIEEACGLAPAPPFVSAETAWRMMTRLDPYMNMLRATIAVFSAGLGGADAITVLPLTLPRGLPDRFARRMARNTQLVLLEESSLARVADPLAGAGGIEALTTELCGAAWAMFQEIESSGGAALALKKGLIQAKVAAALDKRRAQLAHRLETLTGTSDFANLEETPVPVLDVAPVRASAPATIVPIEPLARIRLAEPYERLRQASDQALAETGSRPTIFLANLGTTADFTARATFARNFFAAGGIAAETNDGFASRAEMIAAFKGSGAALACLCSSDAVYAREAVPAARALMQAGSAHLYCAGEPDPLATELAEAGIGTFIFEGCDALAILEAAQTKIASRRKPNMPI